VADHECGCAKGAGSIDLTLLRLALVEFASDSGALIPVLQQAQAIYGYLPREALLEIAERRRIPFSDVYGVATSSSSRWASRNTLRAPTRSGRWPTSR
jgi:hypothetical protein